MSFRDLVDPECGGANPLMQMGSHVMRDAARMDQGFSGPPISAGFAGQAQPHLDEHHMVNEFLGQMAAPPQSFRTDLLMQEMREIEAKNFQPQIAPQVIHEVSSSAHWANEFSASNAASSMFAANPQAFNQPMMPGNVIAGGQMFGPPATGSLTRDFFDNNNTAMAAPQSMEIHQAPFHVPPMHFMHNVGGGQVNRTQGDEFSAIEQKLPAVASTSATAAVPVVASTSATTAAPVVASTSATTATPVVASTSATAAAPPMTDWATDFKETKTEKEIEEEKFNTQFWNRLEGDWKKYTEESEPWLYDFNDYYDPYKNYVFDENNPMKTIENAFEKGKQFLALGDIPNAVLCFESAVEQDMQNAEIWEFLGKSQAENEKDPNAIAALKKSLDLRPDNRSVLMSLAISYTNESLQNKAIQMLIKWLLCNEKYKQLVSPELAQSSDTTVDTASSSIVSLPKLTEVENLFLEAVRLTPTEVDPEVQEALGVLFNLSSEYDKAVECFQAALSVNPKSAKIWNRLGASLANGNRSVEAVEAYKNALEIEPGYIRARYNVGIICINLKSYNEAVEHFLTALNHQASSMARSGIDGPNPGNQMSETIWSTLRMAISLMGRTDLTTAIDARSLEALNAAFPPNDQA